MSTTVLPRPLGRSAGPARGRGRLRNLVRGREQDAPWVRPALILLLACTAAAYVWNLGASGDANSFYAAAVQAGTKSWKAFFFGSLDTSNFITVDKPPASLWVMALSGRIFGFNSLSMLVPQALEGVAAVALLYAATKRWFGSGAGLLAGAILALTPVAALMFRFNNPDALLVLLLVAGAYCLVRALERGSTRWVVAAGTMIGFAFLAKMMQAFLVLPAFGLVYLVAAPTGLRRRLVQLLAGGAAIVVSAGWWVAIVALWPVGSRPMIDGSPDNSIFNLILGYNGLGRIFGASGPAAGGAGAGFGGSPGVLRMFNNVMGGQAAWLLPAALLALALGLWSTRRAARTDRTRAALLLWGGWLVVSGLVFSLSSGIIHSYYMVALAPAIAALVAIGAVSLWRERALLRSRAWLAVGVAGTVAWAWLLLDRTPSWNPWLRLVVAVSGGIAAVGLLAAPRLRRFSSRAAGGVAVLAAVACLAAPTAYSLETITSAHTGSTPSAGPAAAIDGGGPGAGVGLRGQFAVGGEAVGGNAAGRSAVGGNAAGRSAVGGTPPGGGGGVAGNASVSSSLVKLLDSGSATYRWVAAVSGSQTAASLELATGGKPVMAIGGFDNEGGNLSLAQFQQYVAHGEVHYYVSGTTGAARPGGSASSGSAIASWVASHFKSQIVGGQTVYDLTQPAT